MGMVAMLVMWPESFEQLFVPWPLKATYEIWLQLAQWCQRRSSLKVWMKEGPTDDDGG